jgi:hypothetical protein
VKNHPGIFAGTRPGKDRPDRWVVSYRVRGLDQRTKTFRSLEDAKQFRAELHTREKQEALRRRDRGNTRPSADGTLRFPRVHDLRAAASILVSEGFAPHEVQAILGAQQQPDDPPHLRARHLRIRQGEAA